MANTPIKTTAKRIFSKLTILALVFLFVFQPIAPAFAQNIEMPVLLENSEIIDSNTAPDEPANDELAEPTDTTEDIAAPVENLEEESESEPSESASIQEEVQQPSNYSAKQNIPEIDKNTGALNYNFSVSVPPGRNNFQPDIVLSYNSNSNSQNSIFGYGWSLNIPYIQRLSKNGIDELYNGYALKYFYSSVDGELVFTGGSSYAPKTENGSFNKYTFFNNQWLITTKDGRQYKLGYDESSQQNDPANPGNVYKWMLEEVRDVNDNYISYSYFKDIGQIYPLAIKYIKANAIPALIKSS